MQEDTFDFYAFVKTAADQGWENFKKEFEFNRSHLTDPEKSLHTSVELLKAIKILIYLVACLPDDHSRMIDMIKKALDQAKIELEKSNDYR